MPKLIVLFYGAESTGPALAEAAAEGARSVRFSEVDVRAGTAHQQTTRRRHKSLDSTSRLSDYDGIVLAAPAAGQIPADLDVLLDAMEHTEASGAFANTVFAVIGGENTILLGRVARLGGIVVSEPREEGLDNPERRARATGKRTAEIIGWIRHALSHEHQHDGHGLDKREQAHEHRR